MEPTPQTQQQNQPNENNLGTNPPTDPISQPANTPPIQSYPPQSNTLPQDEPKKKKKGWKIVLIVIGAFFGFIALIFGIIAIVAQNSDKLVCRANYNGSDRELTIMYDENGLKGYMAINMDFDYDQQKHYADLIGTDAYFQEFSKMFEQKFSGVCEIQKKDGSVGQIGNNNASNISSNSQTSKSLEGNWKTQNSSAETYWVLKNNEFWWYKSYNDLNDNYWHGTYSAVTGKENLEAAGLNSDSIAQILVQSKGIVTENDIFVVTFSPDKIISGGEDKSSTNISGDWKYAWVIVDYGNEGTEAQLLNLNTQDTTYYTKVEN